MNVYLDLPFVTFVDRLPFHSLHSLRSRLSMKMAFDTYHFHSINLNHSVEFQPKRVRKTQVLVPSQFQLHSHTEFPEELLNGQSPIIQHIMKNQNQFEIKTYF